MEYARIVAAPPLPASLALWSDVMRRATPHLPTIVAVVCAIGAGVALASFSWHMVDIVRPAPVASTGFGPSAATPAPDLLATAERVAASEPFGPLAADDAPVGDAPETRLNLQLHGVIAAGRTASSRAFIATNADDEHAYAIGAHLPGGATLHAILADRVVLERAGALETLKLPRDSETGAAPAGQAISAEDVRGAQQNPARLLDWLRPVVTTESNTGRQLGYRVYPGRDPVRFAKLGLLPGDLVTAVNGQTLDDPVHSMELLRSLSTSDSIMLTLEREGAQRMVQVPVLQ